MSLITQKQYFYVNSNDRISGTHSDFEYELNILGNFDYAVVLQASIPKSYYLVQSNRNTFILEEDGIQTTISIPIGTYDRNSFQSQLETSLNAQSFYHWVYTLAISDTTVTSDTGKYTITVNGNGGIQPKIILGNYLYEQFGFNANTTNSFIGNALTSTNVVKFQLEDTIYLRSNIVANLEDNVLQEVFATTSQDYGNIIWVCQDVEAYSKNIISKPSIARFWITNENDEPLDLNGQNVVFTLLLYKKEDMYSLLRNILIGKLNGFIK